MKKRIAFTLIYVLTLSFSFAQTSKSKPDIYDFATPENLKQTFKLLDRTMDDKEIYLVKTLPEDSICDNNAFKERADFFHAWNIYDKRSKLTKYFNKIGLYEPFPIYETILITYHRYLNHLDLKLDSLIKKYQKQQKADYNYYMAKLTKDSLNGFYIPKDINDCLTELDKLVDKKLKEEFATKEEKAAVSSWYSFGPGLYMRNEWGLWGGSRLQKYFFDLGKKDPEDISAIILTCYYRKLNNKPIEFETLLK
jgi:hypothetical protein